MPYLFSQSRSLSIFLHFYIDVTKCEKICIMPFVFPEYEAAAVVFAHWEYMAPDHENVSSFSIVKIEIILFINRNMNMKMKIQGDFFNWHPP